MARCVPQAARTAGAARRRQSVVGTDAAGRSTGRASPARIVARSVPMFVTERMSNCPYSGSGVQIPYADVWAIEMRASVHPTVARSCGTGRRRRRHGGSKDEMNGKSHLEPRSGMCMMIHNKESCGTRQWQAHPHAPEGRLGTGSHQRQPPAVHPPRETGTGYRAAPEQGHPARNGGIDLPPGGLEHVGGTNDALRILHPPG